MPPWPRVNISLWRFSLECGMWIKVIWLLNGTWCLAELRDKSRHACSICGMRENSWNAGQSRKMRDRWQPYPTCLLQVKSTWSVNPVISTYVTSGASKIWFLDPLQSPWLTLWCQAGLIIAIHYILAWASRTSRNSSVYKILLREPSHKLQSISTSLQFSKISTGSLSLNGLSIKFLFSLSRPSWIASPLICINILYLRHIIHQPDHPRLLLFSFQEPEHRLVSARSLLLCCCSKDMELTAYCCTHNNLCFFFSI